MGYGTLGPGSKAGRSMESARAHASSVSFSDSVIGTHASPWVKSAR